ncbi:hypothetical protein F0562_007454 [Nyssa sinensis]|uniref:Uncharacterized protein n=1 Tax=Nyssa sinensis TaxID=561372 RepID=A0A5J5A5Q5_9ASTE|nr:hypothetical protein F0562_007454 [Nyssa sinensis]
MYQNPTKSEGFGEESLGYQEVESADVGNIYELLRGAQTLWIGGDFWTVKGSLHRCFALGYYFPSYLVENYLSAEVYNPALRVGLVLEPPVLVDSGLVEAVSSGLAEAARLVGAITSSSHAKAVGEVLANVTPR